MRKPTRKLALGTASVLALAIGCAAIDYGADANNIADATKMSQELQASDLWSPDNPFRKDDIRWAQVELRYRGLYHGSLDGILGPKTKRAIEQFQTNKRLSRTASLDAQTWEALIGDPGIGQGSSIPPKTDRANSMKNSPPTSDLGR